MNLKTLGVECFNNFAHMRDNVESLGTWRYKNGHAGLRLRTDVISRTKQIFLEKSKVYVKIMRKELQEL